MSGENDFLAFGMALHKKADELATDAEAGDRDEALSKLADLISACNDGLYRFRH